MTTDAPDKCSCEIMWYLYKVIQKNVVIQFYAF